ncbi:hypothetical protein THAOC_30262 [Thalassiosira oceanica]|uniref:Uncharacterized protein n=1 Tax=Thalassiosira oceanica TaxID=159749 RepID=K0RVM9_THAOC|nr:hypothetical protein THAOC_30262 [Thalassiosira oceanica]|eukprot:EJK50697.1 hypothetical protein THAOC_30262 [Thalassiosira oceanica]
MSLPSWQRKTTSGICSNRTGHLDDSSLGKSRSNFSLPSSAAAARSKPGAVAVPSSEESSVKKGNNTSLQFSNNSELGSAYSHSGDESRPGAVMVTSMLDKRMKKKSEKESVTSQSGSQGNALASSSQGNRLLDERRVEEVGEGGIFLHGHVQTQHAKLDARREACSE